MTDKKKQYSKTEKPEIDMDDLKIPEEEIPVMGGKCPFMQNGPLMCPMMMCPMMQMRDIEEFGTEDEYMRSPDWYDKDDSDYSSDESDEYPDYWKKKKKHKYHPYPFFWPPYYPIKPYKKKHKKW